MGLKQRTINGMIWAYATFFGSRIFNLVTTAILARLLLPDDFGLITYALILMSFIDALNSFGVNDALIYTDERINDSADTAFYINVGLGFIQYAIIFVLAPIGRNYVDDPRIVDVIRIISITMILNGFGDTHDALLQKELAFRRRFLPEILSSVVKGVVSIGLAVTGYGVWSLVYGHLVGMTVRLIAKWWILPWRPTWRFYVDRAKALSGYGVHVLLFSLLAVAFGQADQIVIGILLGPIQLGYYALASSIPDTLINNLSNILTRVLFPTYSKLKSDREKLTRGYLMTTKYTALAVVPIGTGLVAVAPELVRLLFGPNWDATIPVLQVLALLGIAASLPWSAGDVLKAIGRPDIPTKLLIVESCVMFPTVIIFAVDSHQAVMVALGTLVSFMFSIIVRLVAVSRQLNLRARVFYDAFRSAFTGGFAIVGSVTLWRSLVGSLPMLAVLISSVLIGMAVYAAVMWWLEKDDILKVKDTFFEAIKRRSGTPSVEMDGVIIDQPTPVSSTPANPE